MVHYLNPPFDKRIYSQMFLASDGKKRTLTRGRIVSSPPHGSGDSGQKAGATIRFLYNPSTVDVSFGPVGGAIPSADAAGGGNPLSTSIGTVNFQLLFDRTYELWDPGASPSKLAATNGVAVDVDAFRKLTGNMYDPHVGLGSTNYDYSSILPCYVHAYFGKGSGVLDYYGYISGFNVTYTHWTQNLIPSRAVVSLSIEMTPMGDLDTGGGGSPSSGSSGGGSPSGGSPSGPRPNPPKTSGPSPQPSGQGGR